MTLKAGITSAPDSRGRARRPRSGPGFTLIEVLLCIGLLALVGALFIGGASSLMRAKEPASSELFWQVVANAREAAVESGRPVSLHINPETGTLVLAGATLALETQIPGCQVTLLSATERRTVLLGGQLEETATRRVVWFYPEGTCDPFRAQLAESGGRRATLQIDPWTCAPVLPAPAP